MGHSVAVHDLRLDRPGFRLGPLGFTAAPGARLAIVGPSGSGKTTLLRCLAGLERATAGSIRIDDRVVADERTWLAPDRRGVGLVFQDGALWSHMTALQHLTFAAPGLGREAARALLARGGLAAHADKRPAALSGGEAQRLGLLRALAPSPAVLLLDEPLRSVDVHQRDALVVLVRELAAERALTTILVTHDRDEALALADELIVLHDGQLVEQGAAAALLEAPATAFTAAFLRGAACLATRAHGDRLTTPFGEFPRPQATGDVRLVLFPGEAEARRANGSADGLRGRILAAAPGEAGPRVRVAVGEQIVVARPTEPLSIGDEATLHLSTPPRLLPWRLDRPEPEVNQVPPTRRVP